MSWDILAISEQGHLMLMVACAVCAHFVIWQSHCSCPSVMLTEDINSLLPEVDNPIIQKTGFCIHIHCTLKCAIVQNTRVSVQHVLHTVCVYTAQAGVWMSEMVKVKWIGRVSWLLFNSSHNRSCQEYWVTAFRADSATRHVTDIKSTPVEEPMIITLHLLHFKYVLFPRPSANTQYLWLLIWSGYSICSHNLCSCVSIYSNTCCKSSTSHVLCVVSTMVIFIKFDGKSTNSNWHYQKSLKNEHDNYSTLPGNINFLYVCMWDILLNNDMFDTGNNQNYYGPIDVKYFSHDYLEKNQEWASDSAISKEVPLIWHFWLTQVWKLM